MLHRLARLVWIEVGKASNPWFAMAASTTAHNSEYRVRWERWNSRQLDLTRQLFAVVFDKTEPMEELLTEALDFLDGR